MEAPLSVARRLIGIDVRSLAVVRMLLGLLIVVDIVVRWGDFAIFYADSGIVSLHDSRAITAAPGAWSLYWLSTADAYQQALLAATAVGGVLLLLGCWTRWTTIACWVLVASLWNRNPLVCNYGDTLLRMLLFWGMFLPWGSTWSLDWLRGVRRGKNGVQGVTIHSAASAAILLQLTLLYFFTGLWKWNDDWIQGRALFHALNLEYFARSTARGVLQYEGILQPLTQATLALEILGPLALWCPWKTDTVRLVVMGCFVALHTTIELLLAPVYLSYVCLIAWLLFVPSRVWDGRFAQTTLGRWEHWLIDRLAPVALPNSARTRPTPALYQAGQSPLTNLLCLLFLAYVVFWNVATLGPRYERFLPRPWRAIGQAAMVWQTWDMYYIPSRHNGWFSAPVRLRDGRVVDALLNGRPVDPQEPSPHWEEYPNARWRVCLFRLGSRDMTWLHPKVADYLLRRWNETHGDAEIASDLELLYYQRLGKIPAPNAGFHSKIVATAHVTGDDAESPLARIFRDLEAGKSPLP